MKCQAGIRSAVGISLPSVVFASVPVFDSKKHRMSRDVILACGVFNELWYRISCPEHLSHTQNALDHYLAVGEGLGCSPNEWFDPSWYRKHYQLPATTPNAFAHYLSIGRRAQLRPNAVMDPVYYAARYGASLHAETDYAKHYYTLGYRQGWQPSAIFNAEQYAKNCMDKADTSNPITHFRQSLKPNDVPAYGDADTTDYEIANCETPSVAMVESQLGDAYAMTIKENLTRVGRARREALAAAKWVQGHALRSVSRSLGYAKKTSQRSLQSLSDNNVPLGTLKHGHTRVSLSSQTKFFANPGPEFEGASSIDTSLLNPKARTIAFFLPQFYPFAQNDEWWGKGFTEWRNVSRGSPRFENHYQPRIPRDLGFYDLTNVETLKAQSKLAKQSGIEAFCFYYYWFNGERLMDKPLDLFVDGFEGQVLIQQDYRDEDEDAFIADTARYFNHPRYTTVNDRPLFILYRPGLLPDAAETIARWKVKWQKACGVEPWVMMVQGFDDEDPRAYDLDGAVEFPPHKLCSNLPDINKALNILDPSYAGNVRDYNAVVDVSLSETPPAFPLIKTVSPHWDNDARREGRGLTLHGSTPKNYERWLRGAVSFANENPFEGESLVFINAWNEWAEGAYLEPDVHYGHAYLNATQRAVHGLVADEKRHSILLVGHDAHRHGAQMLLKSIAETCTRQFGMSVVIALKHGGPMLSEYQSIGTTVVLDQMGENGLTAIVKKHNIGSAICNTSVTGDLVPIFEAAGGSVVSLIHELPNLISEYGLEGNLKEIARSADHVIFPADMVEAGFDQFASGGSAERHIRPQGNYKSVVYDSAARARIRREYGIGENDKLVLNVGYADLRKGYDLFLQNAQQMIAERDDVHFAWLGNRAVDVDRWLAADFDEALLARLHLIEFTDDVNAWYSAGDAMYLSSREDPYPTVVLEAMAVGMPVVLHEGATGFDELVGDYGYRVPKHRPRDLQKILTKALFADNENDRQVRMQYVEDACRFDDYCFDLLQWAQPGLRKVSVVVPNFNYEQYMPTRLTSIFEQRYPVFETIVLDDCSSDDSVKRIHEVAQKANRRIRFLGNSENSGNPFKQWQRGMSMVRGDLVWIAEADDLAAPEFLSANVLEHKQNTALSFTDSVQVDTHGKTLSDSYFFYYKDIDSSLFSRSFSLPGDSFVKRAMAVRNVIMNVSSVVWNRADLEAGLEALSADLSNYKLVGDWRLYLQVLLTPGRDVAYINKALNTHRRHPESVTHALDHKLHLGEIQAMHNLVVTALPEQTELIAQMKDYVAILEEQFGLSQTAGEHRDAA